VVGVEKGAVDVRGDQLNLGLGGKAWGGDAVGGDGGRAAADGAARSGDGAGGAAGAVGGGAEAGQGQCWVSGREESHWVRAW